MDQQSLCPDAPLAEAIEQASRDDAAGLARVAALLDDYPADPRLHFLHGSLLAGSKRYEEGLIAMRRAVELAPGYEIARFQLGLLELSSGDGPTALSTLAPLADSEAEGALPLFARGLCHLARDELAAAADLLRKGIARNTEHPLVSRDMELIIASIEAVDPGRTAAEQDISAAHLLLQQYTAKTTKH